MPCIFSSTSETQPSVNASLNNQAQGLCGTNNSLLCHHCHQVTIKPKAYCTAYSASGRKRHAPRLLVWWQEGSCGPNDRERRASSASSIPSRPEGPARSTPSHKQGTTPGSIVQWAPSTKVLVSSPSFGWQEGFSLAGICRTSIQASKAIPWGYNKQGQVLSRESSQSAGLVNPQLLPQIPPQITEGQMKQLKKLFHEMLHWPLSLWLHDG